jgi:hypothetical protein
VNHRLLARALIGLGGVLVLAGVVGLVTAGGDGVAAADAMSTTSATPATTSTTVPPTTTSPSETSSPASVTTTSTSTTTTTTSTTTSSTTTTTTSTTTTTVVVSETVDEFVVLFAEAIAASDVDFLFDRLHPAVVGGFGPDLCRNWVEDEILQFSNYELAGPAEGPRDQPFTTPAGTGVIENSFSAPIKFTFQGQDFDAEAGFALVGTDMHWLGQCR